MCVLHVIPPLLGLTAGPATPSRRADIDSLAARAAAAMRDGFAHVEQGWLSGDELVESRETMVRVLADIPQAGDDLDSIQTDLLEPAFRAQLADAAALPFGNLLVQLDELRGGLARHSSRSLLGGGGFHLMRYPPGAKFMRHRDEEPAMSEPRRNSISFLLYLTPDDWSAADGGSLVVYDASAAPRELPPTAGSLVIYDSTIEHEVQATRRERHLISGRFRESDADWSRRRQEEAEARRGSIR
ncbi:hypothetical protein EMIHUDRAFT_351388 [Emiliania huxleyi CCMP1516]|uniref:Fe2OG dioxygenase domain-containing protein n=2 Tax=Emiliania huxleyi TaxID=2903 RepID=A0A0D3KUJ3_EMIH1|nr:hypothetical protein EMIHUDRAFT_351388 [Emiliania huxleyi CCMP1516]EOD39428.1 hypothetical protein EMIHUDRAFT_351388 [Emiliania huxleyi CCMP1516]|eukprot:XP_005791857.1 hypothetical protein EMIHUDRAFT_351388 [Emiliania huxleyi CCMP1516]